MAIGIPAETKKIEERIQGLIDALQTDYKRHSFTRDIGFEIVRGTKYYKLVLISNPGTHQSKSVHAFVSKQTGAVFKPASWKAPAKHVRYNLLDDASYAECLRRAEYSGGYLYL